MAACSSEVTAQATVSQKHHRVLAGDQLNLPYEKLLVHARCECKASDKEIADDNSLSEREQ